MTRKQFSQSFEIPDINGSAWTKHYIREGAKDVFADYEAQLAEKDKRIAELSAEIVEHGQHIDELEAQLRKAEEDSVRTVTSNLDTHPYGSLNADRWWQETAVNFTTEEIGGKGSVNLTTPVAEAFREAYKIMRRQEAEIAKHKPKFAVGDEVIGNFVGPLKVTKAVWSYWLEGVSYPRIESELALPQPKVTKDDVIEDGFRWLDKWDSESGSKLEATLRAYRKQTEEAK